MDKNRFDILLVEDDEVDVMSLRRAFSKTGIVVALHRANDGVDALEMLRGTHGNKPLESLPNVVLLDLNMPKMGGLEFLEEIRNDPDLKRLSVFVLTTSRHNQDVLTAMEHNVAGYIVKPLSAAAYQETVRTLKNFWDICEF